MVNKCSSPNSGDVARVMEAPEVRDASKAHDTCNDTPHVTRGGASIRRRGGRIEAHTRYTLPVTVEEANFMDDRTSPAVDKMITLEKSTAIDLTQGNGVDVTCQPMLETSFRVKLSPDVRMSSKAKLKDPLYLSALPHILLTSERRVCMEV